MIYHAGNLPQYFIQEVTGDPLTLKYWTYLNIDWILEKVFQTDGISKYVWIDGTPDEDMGLMRGDGV